MTMLQDGSFVPANEFYVAYKVINDSEVEKHFVDIEKLKDDCDYIVVRCENCDEYFYAREGTFGADVIAKNVDLDGKFICHDCEENHNYKLCEKCECWSDDTVLIEDNDEYICQDCLDDSRYTKCQDCGKYYTKDNSYYINNYGWVCNDCFNNGDYRFCQNCGEAFRENDMRFAEDEEEWYCDDCACNYLYQCNDCGAYYSNSNNLQRSDDDCCYYCENCWDNNPQTINNYGYKPKPVFFNTPNEISTKEYFGFEIEVDGGEDCASEFLDEFGDRSLIYLKHDGSIDGFEIVTHPMTRGFINTTFRSHLESGMSYLKDNGFRGHNYGGIHIHVSKEAISDKQLIKMLQLLTYDNKKKYSKNKYQKWLAITQRKESQMQEWSRMDTYIYYSINDGYDFKINQNNPTRGAKNIKAQIQNGITPSNPHDNRYKCINLENRNTYEFRIFNSNLRVERIIKDAQVIFSLIDFTATDELPTMRNYLNFVMRNRETYPEYAEFLIEKEIIPKQEKINKRETLIKGIKQILNNSEIRTLTDIQNYINDLETELQPINGETEGETICA